MIWVFGTSVEITHSTKSGSCFWKFAEVEGKLDWGAKVGTGVYKSVYDLNQTLKQFFGIPGNPIGPYKRGIGYVTRFKITAKTFSRG